MADWNDVLRAHRTAADALASAGRTGDDRHRVTVEAQTWHNVPPYDPHTMYRAACSCGWRGLWQSYKENIPSACGRNGESLWLAGSSPQH